MLDVVVGGGGVVFCILTRDGCTQNAEAVATEAKTHYRKVHKTAEGKRRNGFYRDKGLLGCGIFNIVVEAAAVGRHNNRLAPAEVAPSKSANTRPKPMFSNTSNASASAQTILLSQAERELKREL